MTRTLFITVGSTKFDQLIEAVQLANDNGSLEKFIYKFNLDSIIIQYGRSAVIPKLTVPINCECLDYFPPERLPKLLRDSTVIISHGGAGTIFEVLRSKSPNLEAFVVVENETLMNSHQSELVDSLINQMNCPLLRAEKDFKFNLFDKIEIKKKEISEFCLPNPNYEPLITTINCWL